MTRHAKGLFRPLVFVLSLVSASDHGSSTEGVVRISGFSTLGYGILINKDDSQKEYMSLSRRGSVLRDTKVGLNLAFKMSDDLTFAAQLVARGFDFFGQTPANNVGILDWYFLRYNPSSFIELRGGRQPIPFSLLAETQDVGFVNPWIRPPVEVYSLAPIKSVTGIQARYKFEIPSDIELIAGIYGGQDYLEYGFSRESTASGNTVNKVKEASGDFTSMIGGLVSATREDFTVLGSVLNIKMKSSTNYPVTIPTGLPYPATAHANAPFSADQIQKSKSIGARWEHNRFLVLTEFRRFDFELTGDVNLTGFYSGHYATGGLRFGTVMPTLTIADYKSENNSSVSAFVPALRQTVKTTATTKGHSTSKTLGVNTQLRDNVVWKVEYQQAVNHSSDAFGPLAMGLYPKKKAVTVSTSLDIVF
jgi:hypothetical protein